MRLLIYILFMFVVIFGGCATKTNNQKIKLDYSQFDYKIMISSPEMVCKNYAKVSKETLNIEGFVNNDSKDITVVNKTTKESYQGTFIENGHYLIKSVSLAKGVNTLEFNVTEKDDKKLKRVVNLEYELPISPEELKKSEELPIEERLKADSTIAEVKHKVSQKGISSNPRLYIKKLIEEYKKEPTIKRAIYKPLCVKRSLNNLIVVFKSGVIEYVIILPYNLNHSLK